MRKLTLLLFSLFMLSIECVFAQTPVTGKVSDVSGSPIAGATVSAKGGTATTTGSDGSFSLKLPAGKSIIVVSFVGYVSKTVTVTGLKADVSLELDNKALSEVVVTGTGGAISKRKLAFAVESISQDKLPAVSTGDVGSALVGKIAGAQISSTSGSPGQPVNILLRGINSIRGGTLPMILVDGLEVRATSLESLDLNSYERIEVVQGPAAASIYGAQGANGVIQLFSKKGKQGKVNISISSSLASNTLLNIGNVSKAKKHAFNVNANGEVISAGGTVLSFDPVTGSYLDNPGTLSGFLINPLSKYSNSYDKNLLWYDHNKMFFKTGLNYNNSINISGAKEKMDFSFILSDNRQNTVFANNGDFNRTNLSANIGVELFKGLKFRTTTQLVQTNSTLLDPSGRNMLFAINNSRPFANFEQRDGDGFLTPYFGDAVGVNHYNFNYVVENSTVKDKTIDIIQSFNLNYKFPKFVELDVKYGINRTAYNSRYQIAEQSHSQGAEYWQYWAEFYAPRTSYGSPTTGTESGEINNRDFIETFQNLTGNATIKFDFQQDFNIKIPLTSSTLVGWDYRKRNQTDFISYGVDAPSFTPYNAGDMATFKVQRDYKEEFVTYGYLVNQRFDYGNYGGVSVGFRSDYSSAFGRGSKPFTFPRGDAYINLSSFGFYEKSRFSSVVTNIKFRGAYGEAGIQPGAYDRFPTLVTATIGAQSGFREPTTNNNPDLQVEVAKELELGTDISIKAGKNNWFNNLGLSFTYWKRTSENIIDQIDVAPSLGLGQQLTNSMTLASNGIQASLNVGVFSDKKITWNFITNFAKQKSIVESVNGNAEIIKTSAAGSSTYIIKAGEKIGQLYGFLFLNSVTATDANGVLYIPAADHGLYEVASNGYVVNKTSKQPYATATKYAMGDPNPKFNMSFINEFAFKKYLTFGVQLDWIYKSFLYNQTKQWMYRDGIHKDYDNTITIGGQTEAWTAFYRGAYAVRQANGTKSYFYEDASFLRLRNISVGFDFANFFNLKGISKCQLVLSGRNLLTKTKYTGMDPEVSSGTSNSAWDRGVDHNTIPNLKTYQVGLNIGF
jgi:TonB-dependent starch-binding outer membrane protein SusC